MAMLNPRPVLPRLQWTGKFFSDPSTVNNDIRHYDNNNFRPNFQLRRDDDRINENGSWNPEGTGAFALVGCSVSAVKTAAGTAVATTPGSDPDPMLGARLVGNDRSVQAKMSDLDPQMQGASEIWGLRIKIGTEASGFHGLMEVCAFQDMWASLKDVPEFPGFSAMYQSVIKLTAFNAGDSKFLQECQEYVDKSKAFKDDNGEQLYPNGALSIRFRLDNYNGTFDSSEFRYGQVTGYIQPWLAGEPRTFNAGRVMRAIPTAGPPVAMSSYFHLQEGSSGASLYVDVSNSLMRNSHYEYVDIGTLHVCTLPRGYSPDKELTYNIIGDIDYKGENWLKRTAGVAEIPLTDAQRGDVEGTQVGIVAIKDGTPTPLLVEPEDCTFAKADEYVFRLNPAETKSTKIYVTMYGYRAPFSDVLVGLDASVIRSPPNSPAPAVPESALTVNGNTPVDGKPDDFMTKITTNEDGIATVTLKGNGPANPRKYIDGQIYLLRYGAGSKLPDTGTRSRISDMISILVWDKFEVPEKPSWLVDIYPIFKQYANLYPSMDTIVSLDDYGSVVMRRIALERAFAADRSDPHYMPVTRDLSNKKSDMILQWLRDVNEKEEPLYMNIDRVEDVCAALQTAMELEHATLPPYLTALYSIKQGYNQYIADALRDVSMEEMVHFAWACNILIAIGGRPNISKIGFVPKFPGPLPGGLRRGLIARLRKCTIDQIKAFMAIEAPETQIQVDEHAVDGVDPNEYYNRYSIGFLYDKIEESLEKLEADGKISFPEAGGPPENLEWQVDGWVGPRSIGKIKNLKDAIKAIHNIKDEGEGSTPTNPSDGVPDPKTGLPQLSHYFRFAEIVKGRRIVVSKDGFSYTGEKIELNEEGVFNMQDDPNVKLLPNGSKARERMESFSRKYQAMLNGLHKTFNGEPEFLTQAIAAMYQLTISAKPLMEMPALNLDGTPKADGTTAGISFQMPYDDDF